MSTIATAISGWFAVSIVATLAVCRVMAFAKRNDRSEDGLSSGSIQPPRLILTARNVTPEHARKMRA